MPYKQNRNANDDSDYDDEDDSKIESCDDLNSEDDEEQGKKGLNDGS